MAEEEKLKVEVKVPGVSELGEVTSKSIEFGIDATKVFLNATCRPALEQFGLLLADQIQNYRISQTIKFAEKANLKLKSHHKALSLNPKLALSIIENAAVENSDELQDIWATLYVNSLSDDINDDQNIVFIDILKKLTLPQFRLLKYATEWFKSQQQPTSFSLEYGVLKEIMKLDDTDRIEREIYVLKTNKLIMQRPDALLREINRIDTDGTIRAIVTPTIVTRHLFEILNK